MPEPDNNTYALEAKVKEQAEQVLRLTAQTEKAYVQVQDIAVKAVEGSAAAKAQVMASLRQTE